MQSTVNTKTSQTSPCKAVITIINNKYGTGPAYNLAYPCKIQKLNLEISYQPVKLYFIRTLPDYRPGVSDRYSLTIEIDGLTIMMVTLVDTTYNFEYYDSRYSGKILKRDGLFLVITDDRDGVEYNIRTNGLLTSVSNLIAVGTVAISTLKFNLGTGAVLQTSPEPNLPIMPKGLLQSNREPMLTISKSGRVPMCFYGKPNQSGFQPRIFIEAISGAQDENFGEVFITIVDTIAFKGTFNGKFTKEVTRAGQTVYVSQFSRFPQFNSMVRGVGVSLLQKFMSIIEHYKICSTVKNFAVQIATVLLS